MHRGNRTVRRVGHRVVGWIGGLILLLCQIGSPLYADVDSWLMRINHAAMKQSFNGTFVYVYDGQIEAVEVVRRVLDGVTQERLYSITGVAREVVRDQYRVWSFIPDQNAVIHDYRQQSQSGFPQMVPSDIDRLARYYRFEIGGQTRIAKRRAQQIRIIPNDDYRYGYHLWADQQTGLLLRSDLIDRKQQVIEQYLFVTLEVGGPISDQQLQPLTDKSQFALYGNDKIPSRPVDNSSWQIQTLPAGYELIRHIRRMLPMQSVDVEHIVFTDGLTTISVFIKRAEDEQSPIQEQSRMGAINTFKKMVGDYSVTVIGEAPAKTVAMLAKNILYRP